jgi:phage terminase large subunit-like protein
LSADDLIDVSDVALLSPEQRLLYAQAAQALAKLKMQRQFYELFPDVDTIDHATGEVIIYARAKYPKHLEFFDAGRQYRERAFIAANRVGKTTAGAYEMTCHLTGIYPQWWTGRRFDHPIAAWAAGKSNETTRDIVQASLLGPVGYEDGKRVLVGTGMLPGRLIAGRPVWKKSLDIVDRIHVLHTTGRYSVLSLKSYEQGRGSFEGTQKHVIWLDEECPEDIYGECLVRTMTTNGIVMLTFTPLEGITPVVQQFQLAGDRPQLREMKP